MSERAQAGTGTSVPGGFFEQAVAMLSQAVFMTDLHGRIGYWNTAAEELYGYRAAEALGRRVTDLLGTVHNVPEVLERPEVLRDRPYRGDWAVKNRSGALLTVHATFRLLVDPDGREGMLAVSSAAGEPATPAAASATVTSRPAPRETAPGERTGLVGHSAVTDRIERLLAAGSGGENNPVAVIFVDLDQFKLISDSWGSAAGGQLLSQVARRLTGAVRDADTVARVGGEEFVVVCEGTDEATARQVAARLQHTLAGPFDLDGRRAYVRASLGIAVSPPHSASDLLRFADAAMFAAKSSGPGRIEVFDVARAEEAADRLSLGNDLREALADDDLALHYQPVVDLTTGSLVSVEALARWTHPHRGAIPPDRFVTVAENSGLAPALNQWVLRRASRDAELLRQLMPTVPRIAVNISVRHLGDGDLEADVLTAIHEGKLGSHGLTLEITESTLMDNPEQARDLLQRLRAQGVQTAIDDFGTGYSSLGYLHRLPVNTLKIDRSFVNNITENPDSLAITTSVIHLARTMRLATIAEGVETPEQLTLLRDLGCWAGQGYLWSPALTLEALAHKTEQLPNRHFNVTPATTRTSPTSTR